MNDDTKDNVGVCENCQENPWQKLHTCPFAEEINNNHESLCNCCDDCTYDCGMDI